MTIALRPRLIVPLAAALALALAAVGCGSSDKSSNAGANASADSTCPGGKVRFGIEPYEDPAKLKPAYETLSTALQHKLGCPVQLTIVQDYPAEVLAMQNNKLDVAEFGPLGFVFASQRANAQPLASFAVAGGKLSTYTAGIWVPESSSVKTIADLKGRSLALSEPGSTSGDGLPRQAIKEAGLAKSDVKIDYAGGHPQSLLALTHSKVDAAEVNSQEQATATGEHQFDASKYRQIWKSAPIPNDPVTIRGSLPSSFKARVKKALLGLSSADVAKISDFLDFNPPGGMVAVQKSTYQPLFDLAKSLGLTEKDV
jgi:phosphonate transport system substrate-binding protein